MFVIKVAKRLVMICGCYW